MRSPPRSSALRLCSLAAFLGAVGCAHGPGEAERPRRGVELDLLARAPARTHFTNAPGDPRPAYLPLDRDDPAVEATRLAPLLRREPAVAAQAAFDLGLTGAAHAAELIEQHLPSDAPADVVAAAASGLALSKADATERVLVALALRPARPAEALDALFTHYRARGAAKPPPVTLPDPRLLDFAQDASARRRNAFCELARAIKDPALIPTLAVLAENDPEFEVRRAATQALADGPALRRRDAGARTASLAALAAPLRDHDTRVLIAACRAIATYDDPRAAAPLTGALAHPDFKVRVAAIEGLGTRKVKEAVPALARLARTDPSVSVRYTAAVQLAAIDATAALPLAEALLQEASPYLRTAGVAVLAKSPDASASARLAALARGDPPVRVRAAAVEAFAGRTDTTAREAVGAALRDSDPVVVAQACGVVSKNKWTDLAPEVAAVPARFSGAVGADARAGALEALAELDAAAHRTLFETYRRDPHPQVRTQVEPALAKLAGAEPGPISRGADLTGELLPGGAPLFDREVFLIIETDRGTMRVKLFADEAPIHCAHVVALARRGFYDGLTWHRVVPDFVIQGGCPRGDGSGGAGVTLPWEPTRHPYQRGTLGMPRDSHPDSGGCQLFICHSRAPHLDAAYTSFGQVVEGLDVIDRIDVESKILRVRVEGAR